MISKLAKLNGSFKWLVFDDEEEQAIRDRHREKSIRIMKECILDASRLVSEIGLDQGIVITQIVRESAASLFNKRCDAIYSEIQNEIDNYIAKEASKK